MKTDHDVLFATIRYYLEQQGAAPERVEAKYQEFLKLWQTMNPRPPKPLTDAEYQQAISKMKSSAASDMASVLKMFPMIQNN